MQSADWAEVEIQVLRVQLEAFGNVDHGLLQLHQRDTDILDFRRCEGLFFEPPDSLALHQLADEFDQAQDELDDRALHVIWIGVPAEGRSRSTATPRDLDATRTSNATAGAGRLLRGALSTPLLHALLRFAFPSLAAGVPITFLISLIRSCGRHGLVMTTSQ